MVPQSLVAGDRWLSVHGSPRFHKRFPKAARIQSTTHLYLCMTDMPVKNSEILNNWRLKKMATMRFSYRLTRILVGKKLARQTNRRTVLAGTLRA